MPSLVRSTVRFVVHSSVPDSLFPAQAGIQVQKGVLDPALPGTVPTIPPARNSWHTHAAPMPQSRQAVRDLPERSSSSSTCEDHRFVERRAMPMSIGRRHSHSSPAMSTHSQIHEAQYDRAKGPRSIPQDPISTGRSWPRDPRRLLGGKFGPVSMIVGSETDRGHPDTIPPPPLVSSRKFFGSNPAFCRPAPLAEKPSTIAELLPAWWGHG